MAQSLVYFVASACAKGPIKIGCSTMPEARLKSFLAWSPFDLELVATTPAGLGTEAYFLFKFREHRIRGEWFKPAPPVVAAMNVVRDTGTYPGIPRGQGAWRAKERVGSRIREVRESIGLSRADLATKLGVKESFIQIAERPLDRPPLVTCGQLMALLDEMGKPTTLDSLVTVYPEEEWHRAKLAEIERNAPMRKAAQRRADARSAEWHAAHKRRLMATELPA